MLEHAPLLSDLGCKHVELSKSNAHSWVNLLLETTRVAGSFIVYKISFSALGCRGALCNSSLFAVVQNDFKLIAGLV
jgi:hypothetical protein